MMSYPCNACALAAEAAKRWLSAAVPALMTLCNRLGATNDTERLERSGLFGHSEINAITHKASRAVVQLIVQRIVQGPTLVVATTVASQLGVIFPTDIALALLRDSNPLVRAPACACVRAGYEVVAALIATLNDPDGEVSAAAACALGRMGRVQARVQLKRYLTKRPSGVVSGFPNPVYLRWCQTGPMSDFVQLDLFGDRPEFDRPRNTVSLQPLLPQELSDEGLIAAIPEATLAELTAIRCGHSAHRRCAAQTHAGTSAPTSLMRTARVRPLSEPVWI